MYLFVRVQEPEDDYRAGPSSAHKKARDNFASGTNRFWKQRQA